MRTESVSPISMSVPHIQILSHPLIENNEPFPKIHHCPEIIIDLFEQKYIVLLDSGASVSAISETVYKHLKNDPLKFEIPTLPLTGILLSTALKSKTIKISTQIYLKFHIQNYETTNIFLVVPNLATPFILGTDWLTENKVNLNYDTKEIIFPLFPLTLPFQFMTESSISYTEALNAIQFTDQLDYIEPSITELDSKFSSDNKITDIQLSPQQQLQLNSLLNLYQHIFQDYPGRHKFFSYKFTVIDHSPFKIKPYPVPFSKRPAIQHELDRMLKWGVVERSDSAYNNPILSVQKPDGSIRLCLDARKLNSIIIPTRDSSPPIDEILAKFNNKTIFTTLDFASGYWQIPLDISVRKYTSFLYDGRSYQFCVVPFGLNISNAAFGKGLEMTFSNSSISELDVLFPKDIHIYVDDILISSQTFDQHLNNLQ